MRCSVAPGVEIPLSEVELRASRSSGPGGQHANVTASRIEAVFDVDASQSLTDPQKRRLKGRLGPRVTAVAQDARSQARNRELALERLRARVEDGLTSAQAQAGTKPTTASRERRREPSGGALSSKRMRKRPGPGE